MRFGKLPHELAVDDIDAELLTAVRKINQSGWLWTTQSCNGDSNSGRPYIGLAFRAYHAGYAFRLLIESLTYACPYGGCNNCGQSGRHQVRFEVSPNPWVKGDWVDIFVRVADASNSSFMIEGINRLARAVSPLNRMGWEGDRNHGIPLPVVPA